MKKKTLIKLIARRNISMPRIAPHMLIGDVLFFEDNEYGGIRCVKNLSKEDRYRGPWNIPNEHIDIYFKRCTSFDINSCISIL